MVELLLVVSTVGALTGVAVGAGHVFNRQAVSVACEADKRAVELAAAAYHANTGSYAGTHDPLAVLVQQGYLKTRPASTEYTITLTGGVAGPATCP